MKQDPFVGIIPSYDHLCQRSPLRKNEENWEFLLLRCYKYWDFPKGEVEDGEANLVAALRELKHVLEWAYGIIS